MRKDSKLNYQGMDKFDKSWAHKLNPKIKLRRVVYNLKAQVTLKNKGETIPAELLNQMESTYNTNSFLCESIYYDRPQHCCLAS